MITDLELRARALELATKAAAPGEAFDITVGRADAFYKFLIKQQG